MTDKQPTQERIKEFWEWCGVVEIIRPTTDENYHTYRFPDGQLSGAYPDLDLNNLFKYAVTKLSAGGIIIEFLHYQNWYCQIKNSSSKIITYSPNYCEYPALALFWAIWEIKGDGNE